MHEEPERFETLKANGDFMREGLKSLEVLIAAYLAARDGKRVALPLDY